MKYLIIGVASLMMIGLIIGLIVYQIPSIAMPPHLDNQLLQKKGEEQQQPLYAEHTVDYSLQNDQLNITFDKGISWITVPVEIDKLFDGEYRGNKQELIDDSYILTEDRVAFLYSVGDDWKDKKILLTYSLNQGKTWKDAVVTEPFPAIRFRKVAFLNNDFGYVIISGGRTMSQELSSVFLTDDGGENWKETNNSGATRLISDGGFTDKKTGFLSFGTINPEAPVLYVTQDAGGSWNKAAFNIPSKYDKIFVSAETPVKEGNDLVIFVNQGPNGDYKGGEVKGKFVSNDNGKTWQFSMEVKPNETEWE